MSMCLIGNIEVTRILVHASHEEVEAEILKALRDTGKGGGFILSAEHERADMHELYLYHSLHLRTPRHKGHARRLYRGHPGILLVRSTTYSQAIAR